MVDLTFNDPTLLKQALTHRSYTAEHPEEPLPDNERLEFLGDAVLNFVSAQMLYRRFPEMTEGDLTRMRAALVKAESLAALAAELKLGGALRISKGEDRKGGRNRATMLCDAFEAVVGALYLDQGIEAAAAFVLPRLDRLLETVMADALDKDARSILQDWCQSTFNLTPEYRMVEMSGPEHAPLFTYEVLIADQVVGLGVGKSKQAAAQDAARVAWIAAREGHITL
ncbi:MAG: ribonuclease III [Chloroflexota bacterium]|nr:ribonuclease III [Chloroflexota bacterium]